MALDRGYHRFAVEWFNKTGGAALRLTAGEAGDALEPLPALRLFHE